METLNITAIQLRAARTFLGWSQKRLAETSGLSLRTIEAMEAQVGRISGNIGTLKLLTSAFADNNIIFRGDNIISRGVDQILSAGD